MNDVLRNEIKKYIKEIRSLLFCDSKTLKCFLKDFENDVTNFANDNCITDVQQIIEHFGAPDQVARGFFETTDFLKIKKRMQVKRYILCGILVALLVWAVCLTSLTVFEHKENNGKIVKNVNEIRIMYTIHVKR